MPSLLDRGPADEMMGGGRRDAPRRRHVGRLPGFASEGCPVQGPTYAIKSVPFVPPCLFGGQLGSHRRSVHASSPAMLCTFRYTRPPGGRPCLLHFYSVMPWHWNGFSSISLSPYEEDLTEFYRH
uniref:Uncharacterized protein n=1 Tax=Setaria viridis TaxID=4556 RepID=A0A4U6WCA9_SETVI|nr:hypothetical protein SEVIR_1G183101v2 [Setaria viridis]